MNLDCLTHDRLSLHVSSQKKQHGRATEKALLYSRPPRVLPTGVLRYCLSRLALFRPPYWQEPWLAMEPGNSKIPEDWLDVEIDR